MLFANEFAVQVRFVSDSNDRRRDSLAIDRIVGSGSFNFPFLFLTLARIHGRETRLGFRPWTSKPRTARGGLTRNGERLTRLQRQWSDSNPRRN